MDYTGLLERIEKANIITVYRHENPDCDAVGSQWGLTNWIRENWPEKKVYALGFEKCTQAVWPDSDIANADTVSKSLAIILDTANRARVDDQRFLTAQYVIKIDHHPNREPFGDLMLVNDKAAAACEILAYFFASCKEQKVSRKTAEYLYQGLLTDTLNFTTTNTTSDTLRAAAYLASFGVDIPSLARRLFDRSLNGFRFSGYIRTHVRMLGDHLAYEIIPIKDQEAGHMTASKTRSFVDELGHVKEFEIWCLFTEKVQNGMTLYDGSLRSKTIQINDVAEKYNGGGHKNASGVKNLTEQNMQELLNDLLKKIDK